VCVVGAGYASIAASTETCHRKGTTHASVACDGLQTPVTSSWDSQMKRNQVDQVAKWRKAEDKETSDVVLTPSELASDCMAVVSWRAVLCEVWLDPFAGNGAFFSRYPSVTTNKCSDLATGTDFFDYPDGSCDWIVSNPPYSEFGHIMEKSCRVCRRGFAYVVALKKLLVSRLLAATAHGFNVQSISIFQVKAPGWQNYPQAFVVWEQSPLSRWLFDPVAIPLTVGHANRRPDLFPAAIAPKILDGLPWYPKELRIRQSTNVTPADTFASSDWCKLVNLMAATADEFRSAISTMLCALKCFGVICDSARVTPRLFDSCRARDFALTGIALFEAKDTGGHLWFFLRFEKLGAAILPNKPKAYTQR